MIAAGELDQRIKFQQKSVTRNGIGEEVVTWVDVVSVWAKAMPLRGNQFFAANQQQHTVDARFVIRLRSGLAEGMRLLWRSEPHRVTNIIPGTGKYVGTLEVMAVSEVHDG